MSRVSKFILAPRIVDLLDKHIKAESSAKSFEEYFAKNPRSGLTALKYCLALMAAQPGATGEFNTTTAEGLATRIKSNDPKALEQIARELLDYVGETVTVTFKKRGRRAKSICVVIPAEDANE
jgi:hypothetical protein